MRYTYEKTQENGDATSNYNLIGAFPVKFSDFFKEIISSEHSFRINFSCSNKKYGGWLGNQLKVYKNKNTGKCYWEKQDPENWFDEVKDLKVTECWANGGWGQMSYIVTFEE